MWYCEPGPAGVELVPVIETKSGIILMDEAEAVAFTGITPKQMRYLITSKQLTPTLRLRGSLYNHKDLAALRDALGLPEAPLPGQPLW